MTKTSLRGLAAAALLALSALAAAPAHSAPTGAHPAPEPSRALPCTNTAHIPVSDGFGRAKATVERRGGGCGNATVEIRIWSDISWNPDKQLGHNKQFFSVGSLDAAGACYNGFVHVRGIYSEMYVNGQKVAESARAKLPGCVA
ncbi:MULTISPECIES: hypothetical protein [Streptomyces]|uniref:Secreted protein n=1 Tax=Streptomyces venezuelae TaxID=54571 RepID=A0A5P2BA19_STRVZ|nr:MULTISPECIES: hypothetical protein [Streptomyces]NEA06431.1 hypothetical protein [Streptomyces sp. SID10116]MYY84141.1 hypothetical protein [Streptomyces sp. SID335]MYZ17767.1 hypothetical protein [Streptomyces sp. SID337]NDZ84695.1 hypothetical protein [Streptomyces sp. SID10115]NEB50404.1 hypothetical protein [Streptomyces sp. SID339]